MAMLMWRIHFVRATMLRSIDDQHSVLSKFDIPDDLNPFEVNVWFFQLYDEVTIEDVNLFCEGFEVDACHLVTSGLLKKLVSVSADYASVQVLANRYIMLIDVVTPRFLLWLIPDNEDDHATQESEFLQLGAATWGLNRIGADLRDRTGASATIFVLDTGVRNSHTDFGGRAAPGADVTSGTLVECNGDASCAGDAQGHGTHCAGTAGGTNYGVAPSAQIRSVKVLSDQGSGAWDWSYRALDWLATSSIRPAVASMSLGGNSVVAGMRDAVDAAVNSGVVVVVAAGNSNADACGFSPAYVPSAITVGSTTSTDARSSFSCYGTCVDIWAPGSDVVSASHTSDTGTRSLSGTSMACPHVSGAAALILGNDKSKSPQKVISDLLDEATLGALTGLRGDDTNALLYVGAGGAPTPVPTPAPPPGTWDISGTGCTLKGQCIQSNNHPGSYGNNEECSISMAEVEFTVDAFSTESGYDVLTMSDGASYSGTNGPPSGTYSGVVSWSSDYSVTNSGWKLCKARSFHRR